MKKNLVLNHQLFCGRQGLKNKDNYSYKEGRGYCRSVIVTHREVERVCQLRAKIYFTHFIKNLNAIIGTLKHEHETLNLPHRPFSRSCESPWFLARTFPRT